MVKSRLFGFMRGKLRTVFFAAGVSLVFSAAWVAAGGTSSASTPQIAGARNTSLAMKSDGTVWAWGSNYSGQLGEETTEDSTTPIQVSALSGITAIACGDLHSLALKSDGTVWACGDNGYGQLGDGTTTKRTTPVQVSGLNLGTSTTTTTNKTTPKIAGGGYHTLALKSDGTVWAWGWNGYGQLGNGTTTDSSTPVQVSNLSDVIAVDGGDNHSLALKSDGTVWAWGDNENGQLGDGTTTNSSTPVQVSDLSDVTAVAGGYFHSLAVKSDGTVLVKGSNWFGEWGDGTTWENAISFNVVDTKGKSIRTRPVKITVSSGEYGYTMDKGENWPIKINNLEAGSYLFKVEAKGYKKAKKTVEVKEGELVEVKITMKKNKK